ncbi:hypothetical protein LSCM1_04970 [Leishmania martiniquensis]|uniref:Uncharacterized protein n=1 Tax=Leishmania martiniquensis TaxID=1580590 RepID=A0A836H1D2_9TRYP|nr:hypothetical protein LSCM1_04970 [Leishmania martiniquensis]
MSPFPSGICSRQTRLPAAMESAPLERSASNVSTLASWPLWRTRQASCWHCRKACSPRQGCAFGHWCRCARPSACTPLSKSPSCRPIWKRWHSAASSLMASGRWSRLDSSNAPTTTQKSPAAVAPAAPYSR